MKSFARVFRYEVNRTLSSSFVYIAMLLIAISFFAGVISRLSQLEFGDMNWAVWFMEGAAGLSAVMPLTLPLFCALPNSVSFVSDVKTGYVKFAISRMGNRAYYWGKVASVAFIGGIAVCAALTLCLILCMILFPWIEPSPDRMPLRLFVSIFKRSNLLYCLILIANDSLFSCAYALVGLAASSAIQKRYAAIVAPFVVAFLANIIFTYAQLPGLNPFSLLQPDQSTQTTVASIYPGVIAMIPLSMAVFYKNVRRRVVL